MKFMGKSAFKLSWYFRDVNFHFRATAATNVRAQFDVIIGYSCVATQLNPKWGKNVLALFLSMGG